MRVSFLGALSTVGASAVLLESKECRILLDYGTKVKEIPPKFPLSVDGKVDAILLSHCHLDHSGGISIFSSDRVPIYSTAVTKPLTELLLLDSIKISHEEGVSLPFTKRDVKRTMKDFVAVRYGERIPFRDVCFTFLDAGHVPGSAMILLEVEGKRLLYTGDFKTSDTRLLKRAERKLPRIDYLITESTYSDRDHPDRKLQEKEFVRTVKETVESGGKCLVAGFAVGRLQEVLLILDSYGIDYPIYMDGMAKKATTIINRYSEFLRKERELDRAIEKVEYVNSARERKRAIKEPCVILTTSGMLSGGPVAWYLKKLYKDRRSSLLLTGWQLEGTPGRILLETGRYITEEVDLEVKMYVRRFDFSAHVGRKGLFEFVEKLGPEKVFCIHGDHTEDFARELKEKGLDAIAPIANNRIFTL